MIDFKFEVGKFYRSRIGLKFKCIDINMGKIRQVLLVDSDDFTMRVDISNGRYDSKSDSNGDIIGIWEEPKPKRLCYRNKVSGLIYMLEANLDPFIISRELERFPCCLDET